MKYKIQFHSYWHCGSGLAAGADVDALVVRDKDNFPFVPGKTIKGLVREAIETIADFRGDDANNAPGTVGPTKTCRTDAIRQAFGFFDDKDSALQGTLFFTNAELSSSERAAIKASGLQKHLYTTVSSTAIDDKGIAREHSLRRIEVVVPCELEGTIMNVTDELKQGLTDALRFIKRMGVSRNRGLGRCTITICDEPEDCNKGKEAQP